MGKESDKRARIYQKIINSEGGLELTVQGAEGETTEDIAPVAEERLEDLMESQAELHEESPERRGVD